MRLKCGAFRDGKLRDGSAPPCRAASAWMALLPVDTPVRAPDALFTRRRTRPWVRLVRLGGEVVVERKGRQVVTSSPARRERCTNTRFVRQSVRTD